MKGFLRRFKAWFIVLGALAVVLAGVSGVHSIAGNLKSESRKNTECTTKERVFDQAGVLTEQEEEKLRELIAKREKQTGCDIVVVTLNESLEDYAHERKEFVTSDKYVMVYADDFYDEHKFGYDQPLGDGVLLVDNLYRESDGWAYSWLCTTGKAEGKYSGKMIDHLLEKSYRWSRISPYYGYKAYVNQFYHDMNGFGLVNINFSVPGILILSLVAAAAFVVGNKGSEAAEKTTTAKTYVKGGKAGINHREDQFIRKAVAQHRIQSGSGSGGSRGGGGHHVSGSGVSHGGGGHRH